MHLECVAGRTGSPAPEQASTRRGANHPGCAGHSSFVASPTASTTGAIRNPSMTTCRERTSSTRSGRRCLPGATLRLRRLQPAACYRPTSPCRTTRAHTSSRSQRAAADRGTVTLNSSGDATIDRGLRGGHRSPTVLLVLTPMPVSATTAPSSRTRTGASRWTTTIPSPSRVTLRTSAAATVGASCSSRPAIAGSGSALGGRSRHDPWARPCACHLLQSHPARRERFNRLRALGERRLGIWTMTSTGACCRCPASRPSPLCRPCSDALAGGTRLAYASRTGNPGTTKSSSRTSTEQYDE